MGTVVTFREAAGRPWGGLGRPLECVGLKPMVGMSGGSGHPWNPWEAPWQTIGKFSATLGQFQKFRCNPGAPSEGPGTPAEASLGTTMEIHGRPDLGRLRTALKALRSPWKVLAFPGHPWGGFGASSRVLERSWRTLEGAWKPLEGRGRPLKVLDGIDGVMATWPVTGDEREALRRAHEHRKTEEVETRLPNICESTCGGTSFRATI